MFLHQICLHQCCDLHDTKYFRIVCRILKKMLGATVIHYWHAALNMMTLVTCTLCVIGSETPTQLESPSNNDYLSSEDLFGIDFSSVQTDCFVCIIL